MALLNAKDLKDVLQGSYDPDYYGALDAQMRYAFGEKWEVRAGTGLGASTSFPYFTDISLKALEVGQSRRIITSQFIGLSRVMHNAPDPHFPTLTPFEAEANAGWFKAVWQRGSWGMEEEAAFMDGDGLGRGFLQIGLEDGDNGHQRITARYSPTILTLTDRHERHPDRWRFIVFVRYIRAEDALEQWGGKVEKYLREFHDNFKVNSIRAMRIFDYYDIGLGGKEPTHAIIPGEFHEKPLLVERNDFETLPFSYYTHLYVPGMMHPIGRIILQMSTQEAINEIEAHMRETIQKGKPLDIAPVDEIEEEDLNAFKSGKPIRFLRRTTTGAEQPRPWERVNPLEISQTTMAYLGILEREFTSASGITDLDRGQFSGGRKTATEVVRLDQRSQVQGAWSVRQAVLFRERTVRKAIEIGAKFDREPIEIELFGARVKVNDPTDPSTFVDEFLRPGAPVKIADDSLTYEDLRAKRREMMIDLQALAPFVGTIINPRWWGEKVMEAMGEKDIERALIVPDDLNQPQLQVNPPSQPNVTGSPALPPTAGL